MPRWGDSDTERREASFQVAQTESPRALSSFSLQDPEPGSLGSKRRAVLCYPGAKGTPWGQDGAGDTEAEKAQDSRTCRRKRLGPSLHLLPSPPPSACL